MGEKRVQDLLTRTEDTESWIAIKDSKVAAIGTLQTENDRGTGVIRNLAFRPTFTSAAMELLKHLASRARMNSLETIVFWTWENMNPMVDIASQAGFQIRDRMSLMHANLADDSVVSKAKSCFKIKSLADGISIDDFVMANRCAFERDKSRPLERDELEYWIESLPGYRADLQLAALDNDKIVGTVMSEIEKAMDASSKFYRAWVYGLGVVPDARRSGVATCLMIELLHRLRAYRVHDVWLLADLDGQSRTFYETVGFHRDTVWIEFIASSNLF